MELFQAAEQTCIVLILPSSVFSPRNYSDRRPSGAMAAGAGAHAEGLPCPGPGGHCCTEGDLSSEAAEAWAGPAGVSAAARCLGAQTGLSDQLWVVSGLLTSDFLSCGPSGTVKGMKLVLGWSAGMMCHVTVRVDQFVPKAVSAQHLFGKGWLLWNTPVCGSVTGVNVQIFCMGFNKC